jgi:soluble lytic murein transglycosylase-like protein
LTPGPFPRIPTTMRILPPLILAVCLCGSAAQATDLVMFEDGRGIRVSGFELADGFARLTLENGGELGVPASSILAIERAIDPEDPQPVEDPNRAVAAAALVEDLRANELWRKAAGKYADVIAEAADRNVLDRALLAAVAKVESNFNPYAVSPKGACGILQLMPGTAKRFGVKNVFDVAQNVDAGARYLRWLLDRFGGHVELALAGYNAGEGAVDRHRGIPPYAETEWYVLKVLDRATRPAQPPSR